MVIYLDYLRESIQDEKEEATKMVSRPEKIVEWF